MAVDQTSEAVPISHQQVPAFCSEIPPTGIGIWNETVTGLSFLRASHPPQLHQLA